MLPVAFSRLAGGQVCRAGNDNRQNGFMQKGVACLRPLFLRLRYMLGPHTLSFFKGRYRRIISEIKPDVVHALRIPFEGMLAAATPEVFPVILSTWGNDLTLHAHGSRVMGCWTHKALKRAQGLMTDTRRDARLAREWGLSSDAPTLVVPGNGGVNLAEIDALKKGKRPEMDFLPPGKQLIINPRGFRPGSVHNDVFFQSIPLVLKEIPQAHFLCPAMQSQPQALRWVRKLDIGEHVTLLPYLPQHQLWDLFMRSQVYVSLSSHDGTPNTLLEAMACGCFPVVGDIESLREWIEPEENGSLVDQRNPEQAAQTIIQALRSDKLRHSAAKRNRAILQKSAEVGVVQKKIDSFYWQFVK